tara:strand:- start:276 stop:428 length:153 start_codon:yes stop_codon:yes gene_type:complete
LFNFYDAVYRGSSLFSGWCLLYAEKDYAWATLWPSYALANIALILIGLKK